MKKAMAASAIGNTPSTATVMRKIRSLLMGVLGLPDLICWVATVCSLPNIGNARPIEPPEKGKSFEGEIFDIHLACLQSHLQETRKRR
jgi:hypothetical protein